MADDWLGEMMVAVRDDSVFTKPLVPKNTWQLLLWVVFDPFFLSKYSKTLNEKQRNVILLRAYLWIVLISFPFYLLCCFIVVAFDTPLLFPTHYQTEFVDSYCVLISFEKKYFFVIQDRFITLIGQLIFGLYAWGYVKDLFFYRKYQLLTVPLILWVSIGIVAGISVGLIFWNTLAIAAGLVVGLVIWLVVWIDLGFALAYVAWIIVGLLGIVFGLVGFSFVTVMDLGWFFGNSHSHSFGEFVKIAEKSIAIGRVAGIVSALTFVFSFFPFNLRWFFYPFHFIRSLFGVDFYASPYHNDGLICIPLWGVEKQFRHLALENSEDALMFVRFLREYRPFQTELADSITHAACAGSWLNQPLTFEVLQPPLIENDKLKPSDLWLKQLAELKTQLLSYRHQTQQSLKQQYFQRFLNQLDAFNAQTLVENKRWRDEYLQALALWKTVAFEEQQRLMEEAKQQEPITTNVYVSGEALNPELNANVFLGRDDLKDELARRIASARQMPMFLFQGQRRVGKTSLLNFLEPLLGSGFKVVFQDLQDSRVSSVQTWLADLQERVCRKLDLPTVYATATVTGTATLSVAFDGVHSDMVRPASVRPELVEGHNDWLSAWHSFETWLQSLNLNDRYKLILAFDEYEELHRLLQANPEQGARLLAAMRSFSQQQNHIVFLFVGSALFTELENPNWAQYFVQAQSFRVDYLLKGDALRLITEPDGLIYPPELPEQMVALTQGHPALLQWLCSEMVNIANRTPKKNMTQADLDQVLAELINNSSIAPMAVFWQQFCADSACKATVREIINAQPPTDKKQLHRLREHGFIVQDANGLWRLRVPLFEHWLRAFDRVDLD